MDSFRSAGGGCEKCAQEEQNDSFDVETMVPLAVATSIDALAVGVTFAFLNVDIVPAVSFIGSITFFLSVLGIKIGNVFGAKFKGQGRAGRRNHINSHGNEDSAGASGYPCLLILQDFNITGF